MIVAYQLWTWSHKLFLVPWSPFPLNRNLSLNGAPNHESNWVECFSEASWYPQNAFKVKRVPRWGQKMCQGLSHTLGTQRWWSYCFPGLSRREACKAFPEGPDEGSGESRKAQNPGLPLWWQTATPSGWFSSESDAWKFQSPELARLGRTCAWATLGAWGRQGRRADLWSVLWDSPHVCFSPRLAVGSGGLNLVTGIGVHQADLGAYVREKKGWDAVKWANNILETSWGISLGWKTTVNRIPLRLYFFFGLHSWRKGFSKNQQREDKNNLWKPSALLS